jgi:hypothetical protein
MYEVGGQANMAVLAVLLVAAACTIRIANGDLQKVGVVLRRLEHKVDSLLTPGETTLEQNCFGFLFWVHWTAVPLYLLCTFFELQEFLL